MKSLIQIVNIDLHLKNPQHNTRDSDIGLFHLYIFYTNKNETRFPWSPHHAWMTGPISQILFFVFVIIRRLLRKKILRKSLRNIEKYTINFAYFKKTRVTNVNVIHSYR